MKRSHLRVLYRLPREENSFMAMAGLLPKRVEPQGRLAASRCHPYRKRSLNVQLVHYGKEPVLSVHSVAQSRPIDMKPQGFWLSDDACEDNWRSWCEAESFSLGNLVCVHDVTLSERAHVLRLASAYEIDGFDRHYTAELVRDIAYIDWVRVAQDYDGIIITPYIWERRLTDVARWYYSWDCASGCIWSADAIASITLRAQAGEAGTAETLLSGSVHEHAVANGDAPFITSPTN